MNGSTTMVRLAGSLQYYGWHFQSTGFAVGKDALALRPQERKGGPRFGAVHAPALASGHAGNK